MTEKGPKTIIQTKLDESKRMAKKLAFKRLRSVNNPKSIHGIYPYRGKMSAIDVMGIIRQLPSKGRLLDPFCGSGTIVYESQRWGLETFGVDNNPLAVLLSRAKTQTFDKGEALNLLKRLVTKAGSLSSVPEMPEFARKYFHHRTAEQIMRVQSYFEELTDYLKAAYFGAIALTARACNHYKWSSNSIGMNITPHKEIDFFAVLLRKAKKHMESVEHVSPCSVFMHDSRDLVSILPEGSIDFVYTSPPYFDALDYTSYYAKIVYSIIGENRAKIRDGLIQKFSTYEKDMRKLMEQIDYVTNESALVVFVVGDKKTKDGIINGGEFFAGLSDWKPSYIVEREYAGSSSQIWDSINKTKRKEQIVVWDKLMN